MKLGLMVAVFVAALVLVAPLADATTVALRIDGDGDTRPTTRVVKLLKGLAEKVESDGKKEEELFENYMCWAKAIIIQKTASNDKAQSRQDSLETYIEDLEAGRIELTSERTDLEKEIADLTEDIENGENARDQEHKEWVAANTETRKAIAALEEAIEVLDDATKDHKGSFLKVGSKVNAGARSSVAESERLQQAIDVGHRFLSRGDALFLQRVLTGDVPEWDWKKLNRKASFKMSYKARSGKIQDVLQNLLFTFQTSLKEMDEKEKNSASDHKKFMKAKGDQKQKAVDSLTTMAKEGGSRELTKTQAKDEIKDLKEQIKNDVDFIKTAKSDLKTKKDEFKDRKQVRTDELAAISKATEILYGDDARDTFAKSYKSQGYDFFQERSLSTAIHANKAVAALKKAATAAGSARLAALAFRLSSLTRGTFDKVIDAIDKMIDTLENEEKSDLDTKEDCEKDRADDTRDAVKASRTIDEHSDTMDRLKDEIKEKEDEVEEKEEEKKELKEEIKKAKEMRDEEHAEWEKNDPDDKNAAELVGKAITALKDFYAFAQESALLEFPKPKYTAPEMEEGEAPPPPPQTWANPDYEGKKDAGTGIIEILELVKSDIEKDRKAAKKADTDSEKEFKKFKKDTNKQITTLGKSISTLKGEIGDKEGDITDEEGDRKTKKGELETTMKKIKDAEPGCNFFTINFEMRTKNRQIEIDGLTEARTILKSAKVDGKDDDSL